MPTLDKKIDFRCTKQQKETYKAHGKAKGIRSYLDSLEKNPNVIIYQEGTKLFKKKVAEK